MRLIWAILTDYLLRDGKTIELYLQKYFQPTLTKLLQNWYKNLFSKKRLRIQSSNPIDSQRRKHLFAPPLELQGSPTLSRSMINARICFGILELYKAKPDVKHHHVLASFRVEKYVFL